MQHQTIFWFRQDLRLSDNPALSAAAKSSAVLPIYILDDENAKKLKMGAASRWWLHHSLHALSESLDNKLSVYQGDPLPILKKLIKQFTITEIHWNRCYEPWRIKRDKKIKSELEALGVSVFSHNGSLLWEPWTILKADGTPYKVFTPFYKKGCLKAPPPRKPLNTPRISKILTDPKSQAIEKLKLIPNHPWVKQLEPHWKIGEAGAKKTLKRFLDKGIIDYKEGRNFPAKQHVSRLSPHLHFGEISPNSVWYAAINSYDGANLETFLSELGWREFSYSLMYFFPDLPRKNWNAKFDNFPWKKSTKLLRAWQQGQTGIPIVDAGMRELWQTGVMHNRVRMITASFLVKNCLIHWREGASWFWDCLVDADLASNSASWQWVAGCGADAAPYFRIFNPILQGQKFDPLGEYTRQYVPELTQLPDKYLFNPWEAPEAVLQAANIKLGQDYPEPIVDIKQSREQALTAYKVLTK